MFTLYLSHNTSYRIYRWHSEATVFCLLTALMCVKDYVMALSYPFLSRLHCLHNGVSVDNSHCQYTSEY